MGPIHYAQDPQTSFFTQTFIKNGSHDTIHTFKNYFTTVLLVFSFQQNKRYLNTPFYNSPYINDFIFQNTAKYYSFIYYSLSLSLSLFNPQPNVPFEEFTSRVMIVPKQQGEKPRHLASLPKRYL